MSKNLLLVASLSAFFIVGCGASDKRNTSANQALLKLKCVQAKGFSNANYDRLADALMSKFPDSSPNPAVITVLTSFDESIQPLVGELSDDFVSTASASEFKNKSSQISFTKDCINLKSDFKMLDISIPEMTMTAIDMRTVTLTKTINGKDLTLTIAQEGRTKLPPSNDPRFGARDAESQKAMTVKEIAAGESITTVTFVVEGVADKKIEFTQVTGTFNNTDTVKVSPGASALLTRGMNPDASELAVRLFKPGQAEKDAEGNFKPVDADASLLGLVELKDLAAPPSIVTKN